MHFFLFHVFVVRIVSSPHPRLNTLGCLLYIALVSDRLYIIWYTISFESHIGQDGLLLLN